MSCSSRPVRLEITCPEHTHITRTVELKLMDYYDHLLATIQPFATVAEALLDCKRRFKNLPDRHFASVESLVRQYFHHKPLDPFGQTKKALPPR